MAFTNVAELGAPKLSLIMF